MKLNLGVLCSKLLRETFGYAVYGLYPHPVPVTASFSLGKWWFSVPELRLLSLSRYLLGQIPVPSDSSTEVSTSDRHINNKVVPKITEKSSSFLFVLWCGLELLEHSSCEEGATWTFTNRKKQEDVLLCVCLFVYVKVIFFFYNLMSLEINIHPWNHRHDLCCKYTHHF